MNLTIDPWIPALFADGTARPVSLREAFGQAEAIRDLSLRPHERIAVMRLLLCITHAALDGPANRKEWKRCKERIAPEAQRYLARPEIAEGFELFGEGRRFLQVPGLEPIPKSKSKKKTEEDEDGEGGSMASKLDISLASGRNHTLFDQGGGSNRDLIPASLALSLLTFQSFSGESPFGVASWAGQETRGTANQSAKGGKTYASAGPMLRDGALHAIIRGENLLKTLHLNLISKDCVLERLPAVHGGNWGRPVWEQMPEGWLDVVQIQQATETYLGRLVPISRAIRLSSDRKTALISNGLSYPDFPEPTLAILAIKTKKGEDKRVPLKGSTSRALWRELPSFLAKRSSGVGGPLAFDNIEEGVPFDLWVGAVVPKEKNKVDDAIEGVFSFSAGLPNSEEILKALRVYSTGVDEAERMERRLGDAVRLYRVGIEHVKRDTGSNFEEAVRQTLKGCKDRTYLDRVAASVAASYWTEIDQQSRKLQDHAFNRIETDWGEVVVSAARRAYEQSCPRETSRQMQAYVIGLKQLSKPKQEKPNP